MDCGHKSGDFFGDIWICAHCYKMLPERPKRYGPSGSDGNGRQEIIWQADVGKSQEGTKFSVFLVWMVRHIRFKSLFLISSHEALKEALGILSETGERFGSPYSSWTKADAKALVTEYICEHWEHAGENN